MPVWYMNREINFEEPEMFYINGEGIVYYEGKRCYWARKNKYLPCWGLYTISGDRLTVNLAEGNRTLRKEFNLEKLTFQIMDSTVIREILPSRNDSQYNNVYVHTDTLLPVPDEMPKETLDWLQRP